MRIEAERDPNERDTKKSARMQLHTRFWFGQGVLLDGLLYNTARDISHGITSHTTSGAVRCVGEVATRFSDTAAIPPGPCSWAPSSIQYIPVPSIQRPVSNVLPAPAGSAEIPCPGIAVRQQSGPVQSRQHPGGVPLTIRCFFWGDNSGWAGTPY